MKLSIHHTTTYSYDPPVGRALQQVRLTPMDDAQQTILDWSVDVTGGVEELRFRDQHNNETQLVSATPGTTEIVFTAQGSVETHNTSGVLGKVYGAAPLWHYQSITPRTQAGPGIRKLAKSLLDMTDPVATLHGLSKRILEAVPYGGGVTNVKTTAEEALLLGGGVCQDHAQIFIAAARSVGIPARYVSGYLMMNDRVDQEASHGWAEAHIDGLGWVGFDVSNRISPDERYIRLATGLDSKEAAPNSGMRYRSANQPLSAESIVVSLQVQQ